MSPLKALEHVAKRALAVIVATLLWRPGRPRNVRGLPRRILVIRMDPRVGEALLTTPLLRALRALRPRPSVDVLCHPSVMRVLAGHPDVDRVIPFRRSQLWRGPLDAGMRELRAAGYDVVIDCGNWSTPSVGSAVVSRLVGARSVVLGPAVPPTGRLHDVPVSPLSGVRREVLQRTHLASPLGIALDDDRLSFRTPRTSPSLSELIRGLGRFAVINPGGRLGGRRVAPRLFAVASDSLGSLGFNAIVTWGPGEEELAHEVCRMSPSARLAPQTDLDALAGLMASAVLTVCNNTGPMHLSVAVGTPTLALFRAMDMERWGHPYPPHRMVDLGDSGALDLDLEEQVEREIRMFASSLPTESLARH